jgi:hypothetical protein
LDAVDHLTENQSPIAPTRPLSLYFDIVVEAGRPGFDADSFRQGLQEALVQDPDLLALGRRQGGLATPGPPNHFERGPIRRRPCKRRAGGICIDETSATASSDV